MNVGHNIIYHIVDMTVDLTMVDVYNTSTYWDAKIAFSSNIINKHHPHNTLPYTLAKSKPVT